MSNAMMLNKEKALLRGARSYIQRPIIRLPTSNETRLEDRLSFFQYKRRNVVQDNHSFFRTLSDQIFGTQDDHPLMRFVIVAQLRKNPQLYRKHDEKEEDYDSYCNEVARNRCGDMLCAKAACDLFAVLFVLLLDDEGGVMIEVAPTKIHGNQEQLISSVIYSYKSGEEMHSMVPCSEHHLDDPIVRMKVHQLKQNNDPDVILEICKSLLNHRPKRIVPMDQYERLSQRLHFFGFRRKEMIGDGNCLFRSLSDRIYNNQEHHSRMRSVIVAKLKDDPERYENRRYKKPLSKEEYDDYCRRMANNGVWGDTACIQAACDAFGVKIMLLESHPKFIFSELEPNGPCKKVIYGCRNSHHMDTMYPLAELSQEEFEEGVDEMEIDFRESLIAIFEE